MKTILVDDEVHALEIFKYEAENICEIEIIGTFCSGREALEFAEHNEVELAVLDIQIGDMDGIALGNRLKKIHPNIMVIYITAHEDYAMEAHKLHAAAYLTKPYSEGDLRYAVESARLLSKRRRKRIFARTFGHFDLFVDGRPIMFKSSKAKELLALLIDRRGGTVTSEQIISVLWEERPNDEATQSLCSKIGKTLQNELKAHQAEQILVTNRGIRRVDTEQFDCDLYDLLDGDRKASEQFIGEYMLEYSWAEGRMALLDKYIGLS